MQQTSKKSLLTLIRMAVMSHSDPGFRLLPGWVQMRQLGTMMTPSVSWRTIASWEMGERNPKKSRIYWYFSMAQEAENRGIRFFNDNERRIKREDLG